MEKYIKNLEAALVFNLFMDDETQEGLFNHFFGVDHSDLITISGDESLLYKYTVKDPEDLDYLYQYILNCLPDTLVPFTVSEDEEVEMIDKERIAREFLNRYEAYFSTKGKGFIVCMNFRLKE